MLTKLGASDEVGVKAIKSMSDDDVFDAGQARFDATIDQLSSKKWQTRLKALQQLDQFDIEAFKPYRPKVAALRRDSNDYVSTWAFAMIEKTEPQKMSNKSDAVVSSLEKWFAQDVVCLTQSIDQIISFLGTKNWKVRCLSLQLLDKLDPDNYLKYVDAIVHLLDTKVEYNNWIVQEWSLHLLQKLEPGAVAPYLEAITADLDRRKEIVRKAVLEVLSRQKLLDIASNEEVVRALLEDSSFFVRERAVQMVETMDVRCQDTHATSVQNRIMLGNDRDNGVRNLSRRFLHSYNPTMLRCAWPPFMDDVMN